MKKQFQTLAVFILFWCIAFLCYYKTAGAGFVTDEIGWLMKYKQTGWHGIFFAFGDKSLHYFYHLTGFALWKLFGLNGFAWMMVFTTLHAANGILSFTIFNELFSKNKIRNASIISFIGSLLFIVSPYQTEALVWYACIHYLTCSLLLLAAFRFLLYYINNNERGTVISFYTCFFAALFTLELSFALPLILMTFFALWPGIRNRLKLTAIFVAPSFALLLVYFGLSKLLRGSIVGHYGAATHLNFSIPLLAGNLAKYVTKMFFLAQFLPYEKRNALYLFFERENFAIALFAALVICALLFFVFAGKMKDSFRIAVLLFAFFMLSLLPVLNLFFSFIVNIEGDRFTYFASVFACQLVALVCMLLPGNIGWLFAGILLFLNLRFLHHNAVSWQNSGIVNYSLVDNFKWYDAKKIYLLNVPDNYRGAYLFRSFPPNSSLSETLLLENGFDKRDATTEIMEYNMNSLTDSVIVEKVSDNSLKVLFGQWGNWWWRKGIGSGNYAEPDYSAEIDKWNHSYTITFSKKYPGAVYLYQCGKEWREVKGF